MGWLSRVKMKKEATFDMFCNFGLKQVTFCSLCVYGHSFLDASMHLYKRLCPSVGLSVRRSVGWLVTTF